MGVGVDLLFDLIRLKSAGEFVDGKSVIEIGAQQLSDGFLAATEKLNEVYALFDARCPFTEAEKSPSTHIVHGSLRHLAADAPYARTFWTALGFEYAAIDIDGSPGSIPLDLNFDEVPESHCKKYDLVTNFGTTEHVCNQLNAFKIIHDLTKPSGHMSHMLPCQGMLNHGLVNYNPKFFWMLARSNGYQVVFAQILVAGCPYPMPEDITAFFSSFADESDSNDQYRTDDVMIKFVLKKTHDIEFVPPIDVPTGTHTTDRNLEQRYWTVFRPDAFERLIAKEKFKRGIKKLVR